MVRDCVVVRDCVCGEGLCVVVRCGEGLCGCGEGLCGCGEGLCVW